MTSPDRVPIVGGNWKMNTDLPEAQSLARALTLALAEAGGAEVVLCPPFTNLLAVHEIIADTPLQLGGQDVFWEERGAFTGEISAAMLWSVGVQWVICGHSERRHLMGESDEIVNRKARRALDSGLKVILAIGETEAERKADRTEAVLDAQLSASLIGLEGSALDNVVIAYEPVWAIGTGLTATPDQAQAAHSFIRSWMADRRGEACSRSLRVQYGGSVTATNAGVLMSMPDIDGALVGGASLKADDFAAIVRAAGPSV